MKIEVSNRQEVFGLTLEQRNALKRYLTRDNPVYHSAIKFSGYSRVSIPPTLTYYTEHSVSVGGGERVKVLSVPTGVNVPELLGEEPDTVKDFRKEVSVSFPKFLLELRDDQERAEKAYLAQLGERYPKQLVQLPTGKGKSILALHIAKSLGQKTLILVHKDDLVAGWKKDIELCFGKIEVGLIKAKTRKVGEQVTIAMFQTLNRMSPEDLAEYTNQFGLVVHDEVHHCGLNIFNVVDKFNSKYRLGLSATPKRSDGLDFVFDFFFGGICYKHEIREDDEDICQVEVRTIDSLFRYTPILVGKDVVNLYDLPAEDVPSKLCYVEDIPFHSRPKISYLTVDNIAVASPETMETVCSHILYEYQQGHSIIALFTQKEHINLYCEYLSSVVPREQILLYYGDSKESSSEMMKRAESRECLITLATYAKATEGTNVKSWEVEFLVSSLNNAKNVEQATGRIRRRKAGKLDPVRVYDVRYEDCYSLKRHFQTRLETYRELRYKLPKSLTLVKGVRQMFSRGYN